MGKEWTPEEARENASKGGKVAAERRRERAAMTPQDRAKADIVSKLDKLTAELLDASLGQGKFATRVEVVEYEDKKGDPASKAVVIEGLTPAEQLGALKTALAYGLGRPPTATVGRPPEPPKEEPQGGLAIS